MSSTSVIAPGTLLRGRLRVAADLEFAGSLAGEISVAGNLRVEPGARIEGPLETTCLDLGGEVVGSVVARDRAAVRRGARIAGDLTAACILLEVGGEVEGRLDVVDIEAP